MRSMTATLGPMQQKTAMLPKRSEQLLIDDLPLERPSGKALCTSLGRAQFAAKLATTNARADVTTFFLDLYQAEQAMRFIATEAPGRVEVVCQSDLPAGPFDLIAMPLTATGDAELTRDLLQQAHQQLSNDGMLLVATDNPRDSWLRGILAERFEDNKRIARPDGVVYYCRQPYRIGNLKRFDCDIVFRDGDRLVKAISRPGVFSHRHIDVGARALIEVMHIDAGQRVFEIGCGWGAVSLAAAIRTRTGRVDAIDANPRAVECTQRSAQLNGLTNLRASLDASGRVAEPGSYDIALANPPYFSNHRIAEIFLEATARALRHGGEVYVVTKHSQWYETTMPQWFERLMVTDHRGYQVLSGRRR